MFLLSILTGWTSKEDPRQAAAEQTRIWKQLHERNIKNQVNVSRKMDNCVIGCRYRGLADKSIGQARVFLFSKVWVRVPVMTLLSLSKTLTYNFICLWVN